MLKVLIVDNEAIIRKGLAQFFDWEELGCTIAGEAIDGLDAIEKIEILGPDIVISDISMPEMDGLELAGHLYNNHRDIQVIILTGYPEFSYAQKAIEYNVVDFVLKPTQRADLLAAVESAKERIEKLRLSEAMHRDIEAKDRQNTALRRGLFLNMLIDSASPEKSYVDEQCHALGLNLSSYQVLRANVLLTEEDGTDALTLQQEMNDILADALVPLQYTIVQRGNRHSYAVVEAGGEAGLVQRCTRAAHVADTMLNFSLSVGISEVFHDPCALSEAARQARNAQQFASYTPGSVVVYSNIPALDKDAMGAITAGLQQLRTAIEFGSKPDVQQHLGATLQAVRTARLPMAELQKVATFIIHFCIDPAFSEKPAESLAAFPTAAQVLAAETPGELEHSLTAYVSHALDVRCPAQDNLAEAVQTVKAHIETHYKEELTLESLAGIVYLSTSYLSKVFKKETGENLNSYIQKLRIEKARELLLATSLKTYEVAELVGIPDPVYFTRIFKKLTGVKPRELREAHREQRDPSQEERKASSKPRE